MTTRPRNELCRLIFVIDARKAVSGWVEAVIDTAREGEAGRSVSVGTNHREYKDSEGRKEAHVLLAVARSNCESVLRKLVFNGYLSHSCRSK